MRSHRSVNTRNREYGRRLPLSVGVFLWRQAVGIATCNTSGYGLWLKNPATSAAAMFRSQAEIRSQKTGEYALARAPCLQGSVSRRMN